MCFHPTMQNNLFSIHSIIVVINEYKRSSSVCIDWFVINLPDQSPFAWPETIL